MVDLLEGHQIEYSPSNLVKVFKNLSNLPKLLEWPPPPMLVTNRDFDRMLQGCTWNKNGIHRVEHLTDCSMVCTDCRHWLGIIKSGQLETQDYEMFRSV